MYFLFNELSLFTLYANCTREQLHVEQRKLSQPLPKAKTEINIDETLVHILSVMCFTFRSHSE